MLRLFPHLFSERSCVDGMKLQNRAFVVAYLLYYSTKVWMVEWMPVLW